MIFCFKQKTAYEMRISDWSSDVCSSDLRVVQPDGRGDLLPDVPVLLPPLLFVRRVHPRLLPPLPEVRPQGDRAHHQGHLDPSSEERRVGKECVRKCRTRCSPYL